MSSKTATLAKSLHTVSVLVAVAKLVQSNLTGLTAIDYVDIAASALGYSDAADPYGLAARAVAQLQKETQS